MTVYELTDLFTNFSEIDKDFCERGKNDENFKKFLDANFSYYSDNILVGIDFGSNILYQYDYERECLRSSFNEIELDLITDWKLFKKDETLILSLYENDTLWNNFSVAKLLFL